MTTKIHTRSCAVLASILLAACGGDDSASSGGGGSGGIVIPVPTPTPTPTPTSPQGNYPPAPRGGLAATVFDTFGWVRDSGLSIPSETGTSFAWDGSQYYQVSLDQIGSGRLRYFPFSTGVKTTVFTLEKGDGTLLPVGINAPDIGGISETAQVVSWYYPASATEYVEPTKGGTFVVGQKTQQAPASGQKTYEYDIFGNKSEITLNFETGEVTGKLLVEYPDPFGPPPLLEVTLENIVLDSSRLSFTGEFTVPGIPEKATVEGMLFGPGGQTLALRSRGIIQDSYGSGNLPFSFVRLMQIKQP